MGELHDSQNLQNPCLYPSCTWALILPPARLPSPALPAPAATLVPWALDFLDYCKRAIASPAAALEITPSLLPILHRCSSPRPAVLQVQNYCRCSSNSVRIGQPVPLKSTALPCDHWQMCWVLAGSCAACEWARSQQCPWPRPQGVFLSGVEVTHVDPDLASEVGKSAQLDFSTKCYFENSEIIKSPPPPISRHRKPISPLMGPITWLV